MSFYGDRIYLHIVTALGNPPPVQKIRQQIIPMAMGTVVTITLSVRVLFPLHRSHTQAGPESLLLRNDISQVLAEYQ
jgi:hypothetical protein